MSDDKLILDLDELDNDFQSNKERKQIRNIEDIEVIKSCISGAIAPQLSMDVVTRMATRRLSAQEVADYHDVTLEELGEFIRSETGLPMLRFFASAQVMVKEEILRCQLEAAQKGSAPVLIWLGKNYCGQKDNPEDNDQPIHVIEMPDFGGYEDEG